MIPNWIAAHSSFVLLRKESAETILNIFLASHLSWTADGTRVLVWNVSSPNSQMYVSITGTMTVVSARTREACCKMPLLFSLDRKIDSVILCCLHTFTKNIISHTRRSKRPHCKAFASWLCKHTIMSLLFVGIDWWNLLSQLWRNDNTD